MRLLCNNKRLAIVAQFVGWVVVDRHATGVNQALRNSLQKGLLSVRRVFHNTNIVQVTDCCRSTSDHLQRLAVLLLPQSTNVQ